MTFQLYIYISSQSVVCFCTYRNHHSAIFLQRQKRIIKYYVKKFVKNLSNENKHWRFCCLQDKTWIKMPILWKHFSITEIILRSVFDVVKILRLCNQYVSLQGHNHEKWIKWLAIICHPDWHRVNVSENLGKAAALPALPLITPLCWKITNHMWRSL